MILPSNSLKWVLKGISSQNRGSTLCSRHHMDCLTPPLNTGPEGDWICPECAVIPQQTGKAM